MKLTALIPAYNDDYALGFCLRSVVDHFDEIVVLDDASTDDTPDVAADVARWHSRVRYVRHEGRQLGWVEARNRLLALTDARHLFWLDSDDVLCERQGGLLAAIAGGSQPLVRLQLCEMWGDLYHTTQRLRHYDRCHFYVDRRGFRDVLWGGKAVARPMPGATVRPAQSAGPLFFHIKGVKPDRRLVERARIRGWLRDDGREARLTERIGDLDDEEVHRLALKVLLHSKQDRLVGTYLKAPAPHAPRRPEVIEAALPGRFQMVYDAAGLPVDRIDRDAHIRADAGLPGEVLRW